MSGGQVWANSEQLNEALEYLAALAVRRPLDGTVVRSLSRREGQIAELLATGASNKEIGERLHISERTVKNHLASIFEKIGVSSRVQAVLRLMQGG